jgi:transcriptional regulator with XRE-family HTH domain
MPSGHGEKHSSDTPSGDPDVDRLLRIVAALHAIRMAKGLTLRKLSKLIQVDFTHLSRSERGLTQPGLVVLLRWCRALDLEIETLFRDSRG